MRSQIYLTQSPHPYVDRQSFCLSCYSHYLLAGIHHTALLIPGHSVSICPFFLGTIPISFSSFWSQVFAGDCHSWPSKGATSPNVVLSDQIPGRKPGGDGWWDTRNSKGRIPTSFPIFLGRVALGLRGTVHRNHSTLGQQCSEPHASRV